MKKIFLFAVLFLTPLAAVVIPAQAQTKENQVNLEPSAEASKLVLNLKVTRD